VKYLEDYCARAYRDLARTARFAQRLPDGIGLTTAPELRSGVLGLAQLARFSGYLVGPRLKLARLRAMAAAPEDAGAGL
jgi:hypothetical protein